MTTASDFLRCDDLAYSNRRMHDVMHDVQHWLDGESVLLVSTSEDQAYDGDFVPCTQVLAEGEQDGEDVIYTYTPLMFGPLRRGVADELRQLSEDMREDELPREDHCAGGCSLCCEPAYHYGV